jgi:membrane-associated phospholipid phosphatase
MTVPARDRVRTLAGVTVLAASLLPIERHRVGRREQQTFRAVNGLPDQLYPPAWPVMQLGALAAAPATAAVAAAAGNRALAVRLCTVGTGAWALAKVVKRMVRRGRPMSLLTGVRTRGREPSGLGYLSGHAAVATALAAAAHPHLGAPGRRVTLALAAIVAVSRVYVGAHLPLDVAGGAALGLLVDGAWSLARPGVR